MECKVTGSKGTNPLEYRRTFGSTFMGFRVEEEEEGEEGRGGEGGGGGEEKPRYYSAVSKSISLGAETS